MTSIALGRSDVIVGVDTHKSEHVAVAIDGLGGVIDKPRSVAANPGGYAELLDWAHRLGTMYAFGVEGCGSYGSGLAKFLRRHDQTVREVARPPRRGERRMSGKSDTIDAEHAARVVLSGTARRHRSWLTARSKRSVSSKSPVILRSRPTPPP